MNGCNQKQLLPLAVPSHSLYRIRRSYDDKWDTIEYRSSNDQYICSVMQHVQGIKLHNFMHSNCHGSIIIIYVRILVEFAFFTPRWLYLVRSELILNAARPEKRNQIQYEVEFRSFLNAISLERFKGFDLLSLSLSLLQSKIASFQVKVTQNQHQHNQNSPTIHP